MEQKCFPAWEIQNMISIRGNQPVRSTKMETANQKWPNLRYKTYSKPCLVKLCPFAQLPAILSLFNGILKNFTFSYSSSW
jgi:hypothetical protein